MTCSMPNKLYDILKWISIVCVPALITFLGVILPSLGVDAATVQIVVTIIGAIGTFLGTLIGISCKNYKEGDSND